MEHPFYICHTYMYFKLDDAALDCINSCSPGRRFHCRLGKCFAHGANDSPSSPCGINVGTSRCSTRRLVAQSGVLWSKENRKTWRSLLLGPTALRDQHCDSLLPPTPLVIKARRKHVRTCGHLHLLNPADS